MKTTPSIRRFTVRALLSLMIAATFFFQLTRADRHGDVLLRIELMTSEENDLLIVANGTARGKRVTAGIDQTLTAALPRQEMREIKLVLGRQPATVTLRRVRLQSFSRSRRFEPNQLRKVLLPGPQVAPAAVDATGVSFQSPGHEAYLLLDRNTFPLITMLQRDHLFNATKALLLGLALFSLLAIVDLRQPLRILRQNTTPLVMLFLLVTLLPLADSGLHFSRKWTLDEKRRLADKPEFRFDNFWSYAKAWQDYYRDHFGLRGPLVKFFSSVQFNLFHVSPVPSVVIGRSGWLYLGQEGEKRNVMDYHRGIKPFGSEELDTWLRALSERRDWLQRHGRQYLMVFVPEKCTIYPEFLPDRLRESLGSTRLDQLLAKLAAHPEIPVLDLRPALLAAKKERQVYYRNDSHWNDRGGYAAYREILKKLQPHFPELVPIPLSEFAERPDLRVGDLTVMLAMTEKFKEASTALEPRFPVRFKELPLPAPESPWVVWGVTEISGSRLPRAVMFRDSFGHALIDLLSEHFSRIFYIWDRQFNFDTALIERENPDIVIEEMTERFLHDTLPHNPPALGH